MKPTTVTNRLSMNNASMRVCLLVGLLLAAAVACSAQVTFTEYPVPTAGSSPLIITSGPDGNLWFTELTGHRIGRATPAGVIMEFPVPTSVSLFGITAGPDGNLWFADANANFIGRITPAGVITEFPVPTVNSGPVNITAGPDGSLWFTEDYAAKIGRITTTGTFTEYSLPTGSIFPDGIAVGADANLWFTENGPPGKIGKIATTGVITEFVVPTSNSAPLGITPGPDGNLWFTEEVANQIGRISTAGVITEFPIPTSNSYPQLITMGPDGNLWFAEYYGNNIGRITTAGVITEFPVPTPASGSSGVTSGPDGNLWFTELSGNKIGKLTTNFAFLGSGSFVIGDRDAVVGNTVTFWGSHWAEVNSLSGGPAPNAFKGFADTAPQSCGGSWTSSPGNSSNPPDSVPPFMAVIASSSITKSGSTISGDVPKIVVIKTNPGYGPSPGRTGTGTVVAVLCGS